MVSRVGPKHPKQRDKAEMSRRAEMISQEIMAVVVSYNGGSGTARAVEALAESVGYVHVVDNNSAPSSRALLAQLSERPNVSVEYLPENRGVAHALNRGVARAAELGKPWLLTMDQDSTPDRGMITAFCAASDRSPDIRCMSPVIADRGKARRTQVQVLSYAITSGNLVHHKVYEKAGTYREALFIDGVDFDFSLRVRRAGFQIHLIPEAHLYHRLGDEKPEGVLMHWYTRHSPVRRYYMYRNLVYLLRWHGLRFPVFAAKTLVAHAMLLLMILRHDPRPWTSYRFAVRGVCDALRGRTGRIPEALLAA